MIRKIKQHQTVECGIHCWIGFQRVAARGSAANPIDLQPTRRPSLKPWRVRWSAGVHRPSPAWCQTTLLKIEDLPDPVAPASATTVALPDMASRRSA
jgi:hypothetical protein